MITQDIEQNRYFRYCVRHYESLGPNMFERAKQRLLSRVVEETKWDMEVFTELFEDLAKTNDWNDAEVCAYFEICNIAEV